MDGAIKLWQRHKSTEIELGEYQQLGEPITWAFTGLGRRGGQTPWRPRSLLVGEPESIDLLAFSPGTRVPISRGRRRPNKRFRRSFALRLRRSRSSDETYRRRLRENIMRCHVTAEHILRRYHYKVIKYARISLSALVIISRGKLIVDCSFEAFTT